MTIDEEAKRALMSQSCDNCKYMKKVFCGKETLEATDATSIKIVKLIKRIPLPDEHFCNDWKHIDDNR